MDSVVFFIHTKDGSIICDVVIRERLFDPFPHWLYLININYISLFWHISTYQVAENPSHQRQWFLYPHKVNPMAADHEIDLIFPEYLGISRKD